MGNNVETGNSKPLNTLSISHSISKLKTDPNAPSLATNQPVSITHSHANIRRIIALTCSLWGVSATFITYLFASVDMIELCGLSRPRIQHSQLIWHGSWYHHLALIFICLALLASLLTLLLMTGTSIYRNVVHFKFASLINYLKNKEEMKWAGWLGLVTSLICTVTYMLWALFSATSLFHSNIASSFFMIGTGLSMGLFITPCIVKFLNKLCHKKNTSESDFKINWIWLFLAAVGEALISPILIYSCKQDLQTHLHLDERNALYISLFMVISSAILMVIATQALESKSEIQNKQEKSNDKSLHQRTFLGLFLLMCTGITGGTFNTYEGLCKLNWFSNTKHALILKLSWAGISAFYWIAFYRGILKKVCHKNIDCCYKNLSRAVNHQFTKIIPASKPIGAIRTSHAKQNPILVKKRTILKSS